MTPGETLFYLREIRSHWSTSNVSADKLAELEAAKLIEYHCEPVLTVRLTSEGMRVKTLGQRGRPDAGLNFTRKPKTTRKFSAKKPVLRARPLV
jgi:hypothetical protein